ncbi:MAG: ATP-binding protein [Leptotrichiaceae bacterium]|uniref:ATP-binding protein n=1 Tax=Aliarcobacter cryaerophilus TaxID=28198 RepID=UPI001B4631BF|nr:ATP-binding protein [Leptotrichiaceae bacterium]
MKKEMQFKISSALKDIIGKDLINDDFIAIFELVKNSYDAYATKVKISFNDIYSDTPKIVIEDNGKGMNYYDLENKWLFVAYSAKKDGSENKDLNFRDKIQVQRSFAGAKGIGRFSCDRLGKNLYIETTKNEEKNKTESLYVDWGNFENDLKEEFINISVIHETLPNIKKIGTRLEITDLRSLWDREKFLRLKDALAKLINPNIDTYDDTFEIILDVKDELLKDKDFDNYHKIVNGKIQNLIFETLDLKTTKIISEIFSKDNGIIKTSLYEANKLVYEVIEKNNYKHLQNISYTIYYLNRSSKLTFSRRMGMQPVEYGNIFVYKNGLRIYPYGERGEDPLKMDNRKAQGYNRYIGTRETIGHINISEPNIFLKETSSRGDGLEKNDNYFEFVEHFFETLKKLEKYNIEITNWGNDLPNNYINLKDENIQEALINVIKNLSNTKSILSINYSDEIINILRKKEETSVKGLLKNLKIEINSNIFDKEKILSQISKTEKKIDELKEIKKEAEEEALNSLIKNEELEIKKNSLEKKLEQEIKEGVFKKSIIGQDKEQLISLQHQVNHSSSRISRNIKLLLKGMESNKTKEDLIKYINTISFENEKIASISSFVTKADFNLRATEIEMDIVQFIGDYIQNIYSNREPLINTKDLRIYFINNQDVKVEKIFRPLEITMMIDNFVSNSIKAESTKLEFVIKKRSGTLFIDIIDNGIGIEENIKDKLFEFGKSTTNGSGIGLYHIKDIVEKLDGTIELSQENSLFGAEFNIRINI